MGANMSLLRRRRRLLWLTVTLMLCGILLCFYWKPENAPTEIKGLQRKHMGSVILPIEPSHESREEPQLKESKSSRHIIPLMPKRPNLNVYIYTLPERFNIDIRKCVSPKGHGCIHLMNRGFGDFLYNNGDLKIFRTNQFSLEVILHNQLLLSKYRTMNPEEADIFYIPAYIGTQFFCKRDINIKILVEDVFAAVNALPYFKQGKPHVSALAKIEREQAHKTFPSLENPLCRNVTYIVIEKETKESYRKVLGLQDQRVIVAPYPSYGHLDSTLGAEQTISSPSLESRRVFMFLAASDRRTNPFRNTIADQIAHKVKDTSIGDVFNVYRDSGLEPPQQVWLNTRECEEKHQNITIEWMQNSVFCLQPHGDSPTRKSFYDSIVSGCIPVLFKFPTENVVYPFQRVLNYTDFVVIIDGDRAEESGKFVVNILKDIPKSEIARMHDNVLRVARQLQYSFIGDDSNLSYQESPYIDALDMIMEDVKYIYGL